MASGNDERLASPPLSQRIPIARLELSSKNGTPVNDELDAYSKALLVEFSWSDLSPPPQPNRVTTYTLEWDEKPIVLPILEEQRWDKRGILHTVFAVRRLEDLDMKIKAGGSSKHLKEEKAWLEEEFNLTLERIAQARPALPEMLTDVTIKSAVTDTPTSPTATAKEWTSQATLASTSLGHRYDDPPVPWPTSPTPKYPAGAYQPNIKGAPLFPGDGIKAISPPIPPPSSGVAAGLGLVHGFEGLSMKDEGRVTSSAAVGGGDDDDDDDLFQLPISPRATIQF
ncbi:hypothetical protein ABW20_dc0108160 [Dactylellina cionopaga]|nr:hypothetical protein ABW20_dc0108160 [Dactylellina cionopaga]